MAGDELLPRAAAQLTATTFDDWLSEFAKLDANETGSTAKGA